MIDNPPTHTGHSGGCWCFALFVLLQIRISINYRILSKFGVCSDKFIYIRHLYPQYLWDKTRKRRSRRMMSVFVYWKLLFYLCVSCSFLCLIAWPVFCCQPHPERRAAWQAYWLLAGWFGQMPKLCFPACLKLDLFSLLDCASISSSSVVSRVICSSPWSNPVRSEK